MILLFTWVLHVNGWGQQCWSPDVDGDEFVSTNDLLFLLVYYGDSVPEPICAIDACNNETSIAYNNYSYDLVAIEDQCWFAENLRTEQYRDGSVIPYVFSNDTWTSATEGATCYYNNSEEYGRDFYGNLYNWYAANDDRELCPTGWHIPTNAEWMELIDFLGGEFLAGTSLKVTETHLPIMWDGTNESGFSAVPGGLRYDSNFSGTFQASFSNAIWWTSSYAGYSSGESYIWTISLSSSDSSVGINSRTSNYGLSVRCLKD